MSLMVQIANVGTGGETLSYPLIQIGDEKDEKLIHYISKQLESIRCVDSAIFPADLRYDGTSYVKSEQKDISEVWFLTIDGLFGGKIFLVEDKSTALKILAGSLIEWGELPMRWRKEILSEDKETEVNDAIGKRWGTVTH